MRSMPHNFLAMENVCKSFALSLSPIVLHSIRCRFILPRLLYRLIFQFSQLNININYMSFTIIASIVCASFCRMAFIFVQHLLNLDIRDFFLYYGNVKKKRKKANPSSFYFLLLIIFICFRIANFLRSIKLRSVWLRMNSFASVSESN